MDLNYLMRNPISEALSSCNVTNIKYEMSKDRKNISKIIVEYTPWDYDCDDIEILTRNTKPTV